MRYLWSSQDDADGDRVVWLTCWLGHVLLSLLLALGTQPSPSQGLNAYCLTVPKCILPRRT